MTTKLKFVGLYFSDPTNGEEWQALDDGLAYGTDMVRHIRQEFGDCFTICVAGKEDLIILHIHQAMFMMTCFSIRQEKLTSELKININRQILRCDKRNVRMAINFRSYSLERPALNSCFNRMKWLGVNW